MISHYKVYNKYLSLFFTYTLSSPRIEFFVATLGIVQLGHVTIKVFSPPPYQGGGRGWSKKSIFFHGFRTTPQPPPW